MPPSEDDAALLAVVSAQLKDLRTDVAALRQDLKEQSATYLPRTEFEAWRTGIGREIGDMKAAISSALKEQASSRAPWWQYLFVTAAVITLAITLIDKIAN